MMNIKGSPITFAPNQKSKLHKRGKSNQSLSCACYMAGIQAAVEVRPPDFVALQQQGLMPGENGQRNQIAMNSPRPQRGQGRSDLFSKENLRFSPPPTPSPTKILPAPPPPPTHVGWPKNPVRRAWKFLGFVGVQLHGSIFVENVLEAAQSGCPAASTPPMALQPCG